MLTNESRPPHILPHGFGRYAHAVEVNSLIRLFCSKNDDLYSFE
jgi:hypothetical protein